MLSVTFDDRGGDRGVGLMILTFPLTSAGPGPTSAALKFYIFSAEIAIPLRLMLIPVFHNGVPGRQFPKGDFKLYFTILKYSYIILPIYNYILFLLTECKGYAPQ